MAYSFSRCAPRPHYTRVASLGKWLRHHGVGPLDVSRNLRYSSTRGLPGKDCTVLAAIPGPADPYSSSERRLRPLVQRAQALLLGPLVDLRQSLGFPLRALSALQILPVPAFLCALLLRSAFESYLSFSPTLIAYPGSRVDHLSRAPAPATPAAALGIGVFPWRLHPVMG